MRINLQNQTLRVGINANPPYTFVRLDQDETKWLASGGSEVHLVELLSDYFNFSIKYINCHRSWGSKSPGPNSTWSGLVGLLIDQELDLGIGGTSINYDRAQYIPFLYPHIITAITYITPMPKTFESFDYLIFKPFESSLWYLFAMTLILCFLLDRLVHKLLRKSDLFWISFVIILRQHYTQTKAASNSTTNIWIPFWLFSMFILATIYAGSLYSVITVPRSLKALDSVDKLFGAILHGSVTPYTIHKSYYTEAFKESEIKVFRDIGDLLKGVQDEAEGFKIVKESTNTPMPKVFVTLRDSLHYMLLIFGDGVYLPPDNIDSSIFTDLVSLPFRPHFPYVRSFDLVTRQLATTGIVNHLKELEYLKLTRTIIVGIDEDQVIDSSFSLGMDHMDSFFWIYLFSIMVFTMVFFIEIAIRLISMRMARRISLKL